MEYGAVFVTTAVPPPVVIFEDSSVVESFQSTLEISRGRFGEHEVSLQTAAMRALEKASHELSDSGLTLSARAADSGGRSYEDTVRLWNRNVTRGVEHWTKQGRLDVEEGENLLSTRVVDQVPIVLELEESHQIYFGTYFNRSILYSVAAPGASQHLSLLAFDVAEYQDETVEEFLNSNGWYRTVAADLPHFTFLGHPEAKLPELGLAELTRTYESREYRFWTPALNLINAH